MEEEFCDDLPVLMDLFGNTQGDTDMQACETSHFFRFQYTKPSDEIKLKMTAKITALQAKIEERKSRVRLLREEYKITDAIYINLLEQAREAVKHRDGGKMSYSVSASAASAGSREASNSPKDEFTVGAGVVNNLLTETDFIKNEELQLIRLDLIVRNLKDRPDNEGKMVGHNLSEDELKYLGF